MMGKTLCSVFEDADTAVGCMKVSETECSSSCPTNMFELELENGWTCEAVRCLERIPINGTCMMLDDTLDCYSIDELNRCFDSCPPQTETDRTDRNNPKCIVDTCESRKPNDRGSCYIIFEEECYNFENHCVTECPGGMSGEYSASKVICLLLFVHSFLFFIYLNFIFDNWLILRFVAIQNAKKGNHMAHQSNAVLILIDVHTMLKLEKMKIMGHVLMNVLHFYLIMMIRMEDVYLKNVIYEMEMTQLF
jgi:hypothetical protein